MHFENAIRVWLRSFLYFANKSSITVFLISFLGIYCVATGCSDREIKRSIQSNEPRELLQQIRRPYDLPPTIAINVAYLNVSDYLDLSRIDPAMSTFEWNIAKAPTGSQALIASVCAKSTRIDVDIPGDYIIHLVAAENGVSLLHNTLLITVEKLIQPTITATNESAYFRDITPECQTPLEIIETFPPDGATGVNGDTTINARFNKNVVSYGFLTDGSPLLQDSKGRQIDLIGIEARNNNEIHFKLANNLPTNEKITVTFPNTLFLQNGTELSKSRQWSFTTGTDVDVALTSPPNGAILNNTIDLIGNATQKIKLVTINVMKE